MLPADRRAQGIEVHSKSYHLLRWVADAVRKRFIPATHAHEYANTCEGALAWMEDHYINFPGAMRRRLQA
jgi:hypothetical protein